MFTLELLTLKDRIEAATLIAPGRNASCRCGARLLSQQERKDRLCTRCADAPAVVEICGNAMAAFVLAKVHGNPFGQELDSLNATVEKWNAGDYADAFGEDLPRASALQAEATEAQEDLPEPTQAEIDAQWFALEEQGNFFGGRNDN